MAFVYAWIVPLWVNQLLPQLLMEQFDILPMQCRHIEHMHEGVYNFCFFAQILLKSSFGLNYNLPSFFTDSYCARVRLIDFFHSICPITQIMDSFFLQIPF